MTTINNSENLIEKVGGIEKAREIVEGAPEGATHYSKGYYYIKTVGDLKMWDERWFNIEPHKSRRLKCLSKLRTAIAEKDTDHVTDIRNHVSLSTRVVDL